jgi:hypothetical protein
VAKSSCSRGSYSGDITRQAEERGDGDGDVDPPEKAIPRNPGTPRKNVKKSLMPENPVSKPQSLAIPVRLAKCLGFFRTLKFCIKIFATINRHIT